MKTKFVYVIICIAVCSVLAGYIAGKLFMAQNHIITLTRDGFYPDNILIAKGDTVTWVNADTRNHWPSSNSHPTHDEYKTQVKGCIGSALDACRGLKKGETYSFKFEQEGVVGMHDHLLPGDTMSVTVVGKITYLLNLNKEKAIVVADSHTPFQPQEFRTLNYTEKRLLIRNKAKKDPKTAWEFLIKAAIVKGEVVDNVHEFAHTIGREAYRQNGFEGIKICSKDFAYGCYHGVTEQALLTRGKNAIPEIEGKCLKLYPPLSEKQINDPGCIHGMGHGLLTWNNLDINKSLEDCDEISKDYRQFCWDGVFMEHSMSDVISFDENDPWKFCRELSLKYQQKCASYSIVSYSRLKEFNAKLFADFCSKAPDKEMEYVCNHRIGFRIGQYSKGDLSKILSECRNINKNEVEIVCLIGAAREVAFQKYANWKTTAQLICREVPQEYAIECNKFDIE
jgi:plastocyanin